MILAPVIPLQFSNDGSYKNHEDMKSLVRFHLTNLILTNPGEKISDPDYGVGIRRYLFENNTSEVSSAIRSEISDQVSKKLTYLRVTSIEVNTFLDGDTGLKIRIEYSVDNLRLRDVLSLDVSLNGGTSTFTGGGY